MAARPGFARAAHLGRRADRPRRGRPGLEHRRLDWSTAKRLAFIAGIVFLPTAVFVLPAALWAAFKGRTR
jgi:hypothetical protein